MSESSFPTDQSVHAVNLLEDKPALVVGEIDSGRLFQLLLLFTGPSLFFLIVFPGLGTAAMCVGSALASFRLSRFRGEPQAVGEFLSRQKSTVAIGLAAILVMQWIATATSGNGFVGNLFYVVYIFIASAFTIGMSVVSPGKATPATTNKKAVVPRAVVSTETLRAKRAMMDAGLAKLATLTVFSANDPALDQAWEKRNIDSIEAILKKGDGLTRSNWQQGIAVFNSAAADVDIARGKLRYLVTESETALAPYNIDYASIDVSKSQVLEGYAPIATRHKFLTEKADYTTGTGLGIARVVNGQTPWQVAAVVGVSIAIWHFVNRSKALRLLKEMQGKLVVNAEAATGDFGLIRDLLTTRVIPQFDGLLEVTSHLESELSDVRSVTDPAQTPGARDRAFRLARSLVEGKRFLEMMAGD